MEAAIGSTGLAPPLADEHSGALDAAAGMAVDDGGGDGGQQSEEVASELRDQALGLISDAQTAGDRREKEALLKQVRGSRSIIDRSIDRWFPQLTASVPRCAIDAGGGAGAAPRPRAAGRGGAHTHRGVPGATATDVGHLRVSVWWQL